jgi:hypothetical protein
MAPMTKKPLEEITLNARKISVLAQKSERKELTSDQPLLPFKIEKEVELEGVGMGVLSDGTPYLNQRGLAALCGVQNTHIGNIGSQWNEVDEKPRIKAIKAILAKAGLTAADTHFEAMYDGQIHHCYPAEICLAILEYYAFDAGQPQPQARDNFRLLAGSKLKELIFSQVGYDPTGAKKFDKWHERVGLNYQSAPKGFFHVFNEAHTIIYEMIMAGAPIGSNIVVDISIGQHWSKHWCDNSLGTKFGDRAKYPHRYPEDHPQAKSNPQESWCYPLAALGQYRGWLQDEYIEGGKFGAYLKGKVARGEIAPSMAHIAIAALTPQALPGQG